MASEQNPVHMYVAKDRIAATYYSIYVGREPPKNCGERFSGHLYCDLVSLQYSSVVQFITGGRLTEPGQYLEFMIVPIVPEPLAVPCGAD